LNTAALADNLDVANLAKRNIHQGKPSSLIGNKKPPQDVAANNQSGSSDDAIGEPIPF
jgi:hypothetical protein